MMKARRDIQVLRAIAVGSVFLFHLFPKWFPSGFLGVDIFFVISGFLLTPSIEQIIHSDMNERKQLLKNFYLRRFFRLIPALVVVVLLFCICMLLFGPLAEQRYAFIQAVTALLNISNFEAYRLSQGNYFHPDPNGLLHTWSLSAEEQVFIILPIVFLAIQKILRINFRQALLLIFTLGFTLYMLVNFSSALTFLPYFIGDRNFFYFSPLFRATEFLIGSLTVTFAKNLIALSPRLIGLLLIFQSSLMLFPIKNTLLLPLSVFTVALILANKRIHPLGGPVMRLLSKIGDASYSIYLVHLPVIYIAKHSLTGSSFSAWVVPCIATLSTFAIGHVSFVLLETKLRDKIFNIRLKSKLKIVGFIIVMPLMITIGLRIGSTNFYFLATPPTLVGTISCDDGGDVGYCGDLSAQNKQNFLLIGDSHAAALSETFQKEVLRRGGNPLVMYGRGCPLSLQGYKSKEQDLTPCQQYLMKVKELTSRSNLILFVAQRSSQETYPDIAPTQDLINSVLFLSRYAMKVYVISPNPEFQKGHSQGSIFSLTKKTAMVLKKNMLPASFF